ncbi:P-loop containing nucleoside triphosphate hydrolase protein [Mycena maculata]|uniref:P-loop containing nucleoside triphosphate hydrolase protein n=1 Tax=Mycena maculata TaxID=230809 RepID=A0AAD7KG29_9AGAR|nr:P-loop containing nucleoside triphosphate hydrolase protein [Mycena maculata]
MTFNNPFDGPQGQGDAQFPWITSFMGLSSVFAALGMISQAYLGSSIKLLILGSVVETGRRLCQWLIVRFRFQYSMTAQFDEGDPAYEWMVLFLTQENVWRRSREFVVNATNSRRKWSVKTWVDPTVKGNAEYVPTYQLPQLFRWRGHWLEIKRSKDGTEGRFTSSGTYQPISSIIVTIYTLDMNLLSELVEDARSRYVEVNRPNVVIHLADSPHYGPAMTWNNVKHKVRRPLSSIILQEGVVDALVRDAQEFISTEDWYVEAGIPHRRGYLLYGPPGTGKTSTIYALAGALNLEIYSLSLASSFVDDSFLQRAASAIPKNALFLIEDIDCAFASRDDEDELEDLMAVYGGAGGVRPFGGGEMVRPGGRPRSLVTLSGLLNVIDGVGSEEGKLFFATTNYIDRLDPALLRPGRIDHKVAYDLATADQANALFLRFFPESRFPHLALPASSHEKDDTHPDSEVSTIQTLAAAFSAAIPAGEFSTAELQCYLQAHKTTPAAAVEGARAWVEGGAARGAAGARGAG